MLEQLIDFSSSSNTGTIRMVFTECVNNIKCISEMIKLLAVKVIDHISI